METQLPDLDEDNVVMIAAATASMQLTNSSSLTPTPTVTATQRPPSPSHHLHHPHHHHHHTRRKSSGVSLHGGGKTMSIIELMHHIVREPAPRLPEGRFTKQAEQFVDACLEKEVDMRGTLGVLLVSFSSSCAFITSFDDAFF